MATTAAFSSLRMIGRSFRPWLGGRVRTYAAFATVSFTCYILDRLIDGRVSILFAVIGVGACGWSWLLARALFDPARHDVWWPRIFALFVVTTGALAVLIPAGSIGRIAGSAYALGGSATLMLTFVEPFHGYRRDLPAAEKRFRFSFLAVYALLVGASVLGLEATEARIWDDLVKSACAVVGLGAALAAVRFRLRHPLTGEGRSSSARRAPTEEDARLAERLLGLIRDEQIDINPELRIGDIAARLGVPEHKVSQCINVALGFANFNRLINHHRIERAKRLLAETGEGRSILDVAFDCGFGSVGPFNRAFKGEVGVTPRAFRKASRRLDPALARP
ncbi:MAG: AraC family transcriptional regulator [Brevundimonas sp.]|uniref:helix-turn-helix domain-containing protein n=1 Tax=Brevundimonas sp. TaxID=1871086 RepID=UPI00272652F2|nr:AraC family transcriptional regulator [Brevundimonas sp.]MDO9587746.1 AraC family transcriptional regulator [Brevundimonas sp.]